MDEAPIASTKSNEWYTPRVYIEAARAVMGGIDLDPASCELANKTVKASKYYTKEDNGLMHPWHGRVWLNPPYTRTPEMKGKHQSTIGKFTRKLLEEHQNKNVSQAVLLATNQLDAPWFYPLWDFTICFMPYKIHFITDFKENGTYSHMFGTCFVYLGPNITRFAEHFTAFGPVVTPDGVHRRPASVTQPSLFDTDHTA
jgi:ParB family chromosome partitioning protein